MLSILIRLSYNAWYIIFFKCLWFLWILWIFTNNSKILPILRADSSVKNLEFQDQVKWKWSCWKQIYVNKVYAGYIIFIFSYCIHDSNKMVRKFENLNLPEYKSFKKTCKKSNIPCLFNRNIVSVGSPNSSPAHISGRVHWNATG